METVLNDFHGLARGKQLTGGLAKLFTIKRLKLPTSLYKCSGMTNIIENSQGGVQKRTANVTRWRTGDVQRWVASAWLLREFLSLQLRPRHPPLDSFLSVASQLRLSYYLWIVIFQS